MIAFLRAVVVAQLALQLLPTPEVSSSNPLTLKFLYRAVAVATVSIAVASDTIGHWFESSQ